MRDVFVRDMDVPYKNFCLACVPGARSAQGREDGCVFLWLLSLHKQRSALQQPKADQVTRPPQGAESLAPALKFFACLQANKSTAFTPYGRESLYFACAKKSNQKKAHPVLAPSALGAPGPHAIREFFKGTSLSL